MTDSSIILAYLFSFNFNGRLAPCKEMSSEKMFIIKNDKFYLKNKKIRIIEEMEE